MMMVKGNVMSTVFGMDSSPYMSRQISGITKLSIAGIRENGTNETKKPVKTIHQNQALCLFMRILSRFEC